MHTGCGTAEEDAFLLYTQMLIYLATDMQQETEPARQPEQQSQQPQAAEAEAQQLQDSQQDLFSACSSPNFDHELDIQYAWPGMQENL